MSANNWAKCPRCADNIEYKYGKISLSEFKKLLENEKSIGYETLREDYEIGIYNGKFFISYLAHCNRCGFEFKYEYEEMVNKGVKNE